MTERGPHQCLKVYEEGMSRGWIQALLGDAKNGDKKQWAQTDAQKVLPGLEEELFYCAGD